MRQAACYKQTVASPLDDASLRAARRRRIQEHMGGGVLLLAAAPERPRTADILYPYRQDSDFDYVTAFPEPEAVCVLAPDAAEHFVLFVRPRDPERELWVGARAGVEGAVARYGADAAFKLDELEQVLPRFLEKASQVWHTVLRDDPLSQRLMALIRRAQEARPRTGTGPTTLREPGDILHEMRLRKEPAELARMRDAIAIACEAHREAMRSARPGMYEYEIEALIDFTFRRRGATGPAYPSIVASGANATVLHYTDNDRPLGERELLLIDAGAERAGYCADVTRTIPTGTRYEPAQRDLYEAVLAAQLAAIAAVGPGTTLEAVHRIALRVLVEALIAHGVLGGTVEEAIEKETYRRFYMHRTSHWLGRDVHDVGRYAENGAPRVLEAGMVLTVEPGLYIPADAEDVPAPYRGVGIRIEDDVLVTEAGCEVLSAAAPKQVEEVEALRAEAR
jgi:Xaa-Pro aminopeptidase